MDANGCNDPCVIRWGATVRIGIRQSQQHRCAFCVLLLTIESARPAVVRPFVANDICSDNASAVAHKNVIEAGRQTECGLVELTLE